jgi:outer membrane protein TolC
MSFKSSFFVMTLAVVVATSIAVAQQGRSETPVAKLIEERNQLLRKRVELVKAQYETGVASLEAVILAERELLQAQLDLATTAKERVAIRETQLKIAKEHEKRAEALFASGLRPESELITARIDRLTAQINLIREREMQ